MRLESLRVKGLTRYDEASVDFAALGPGLIAIAGKNGEGKTSILEAPFAALHLELPTRPGNLAGNMHGKDACLDLSFTNGAPYRALVAVDAIGRTSEAYLYSGDGSPVTDGKIRSYTAEIEKRFGSARLFLSACLSAQNKKGSFLDLSKVERKELLAEILDTSGLQALSEAAREKAKAEEKRLDTLRGELAAMRQELEALEVAPGLLLDLNAQRNHLTEKVTETETRLEQARHEYAEAKAKLAVAEEQAKGRQAKELELAQARKDLQETTTRLDALAGERERLQKRIGDASKQAEAEVSRLPEYQAAEVKAHDLVLLIEAAQAEADRLQKEIEASRSAYREAEDACRQADRIKNQIQAAMTQAALLTEVPCGGLPPYSGCRLISAAKTAGDTLPELEACLDLLQPLPDLAQLREAGASLEGSLRTVREELQSLTRERETHLTVASKAAVAKAADSRLAELERELIEGEGAIVARGHEYEKLIHSIEDRIVPLERQLSAGASANLDSLKEALNTKAAEGRKLKEILEDQRKAQEAAAAEIVKAEERAQRTRELALTLDMKAAGEADILKDLAEWSVLERALGRDGIQALMIDQAGPELSTLTNDLLHSSFTDRFEVRFVTQVPKADGKSQKEVFDVIVTDHDRGREGAVDSLSGGEKVIISEAISLALAIYIGKHSGRTFSTLFRDETAGALDPENAHHYIAMLRKAREISGAHQFLFICQQPELWSQADAVLWTEGGKIEVRQ